MLKAYLRKILCMYSRLSEDSFDLTTLPTQSLQNRQKSLYQLNCPQ